MLLYCKLRHRTYSFKLELVDCSDQHKLRKWRVLLEVYMGFLSPPPHLQIGSEMQSGVGTPATWLLLLASVICCCLKVLIP